ncbi:MAG: hypothetical protein NC489_33765 [Ruminococcus flavefaciens]|nr:hypothetical protein [Ruminococcus flavefaciens]
MMGIHRSELESLGGKTVLIYQGNKMVIIIPDSIDFTSLDVIAKTKDITIKANDIHIVCDSITIEADTVDITADVTIHGNFTTEGGQVHLN